MLVHAGQHRTEDKNTDNTQTKHNPEKANNTKHGKTKQPQFSRLLRDLAKEPGGLILQCSQAHTGQPNRNPQRLTRWPWLSRDTKT